MSLEAGYGQADITPPVGAAMNGFIARIGPSEAVDLPLRARALSLRDGGERVLLVALDALGLSQATCDEIAAAARDRLDVPADHVVIHCSHTHAGAMTCRLRGLGDADPAEFERVREGVLAAAAQAVESARPAALRYGTAPVQIGVNRRQVVPGRGMVLGEAPNRPADTAVRVVQLLSDEASIVLFCHACHPYCLGPEHQIFSPDFFGHAADALAGADHAALYINGCSGDIAPRRANEGPAAARDQGRRLADAVLEALRGARDVGDASLDVAAEQIELGHQPLPPFAELEAQLALPDRTVREEDRARAVVRQRMATAWAQWLGELKQAAGADGDLPPARTAVSVVRLGRTPIVSLPGEVFFETGEAIARRLDADMAVVGAYAHGYVGYVPPAAAFDEGGYEADEAHRFVGLWKLGRDATDRLIETATALWLQMGGKQR